MARRGRPRPLGGGHEPKAPVRKLGQVQASGLHLLSIGLGGAILAAGQAMGEARGILGIVIWQPS